MSEMLFKRIKDWVVSITSFRNGDVIPVDGPSGTAKMSKDDLLKETAQNALETTIPEVLSIINSAEERKVEVNGGLNLFNFAKATEGVYVNSYGTLSTSASYSVSGFIAVEAGATYTATRYGSALTNNSNIKFGFYDDGLNFVDSSPSNSVTFTTPVGCKYLRLSYYGDKSTKIMLTKGSTVVPYEKYSPIDGILKKDSQFFDNFETQKNLFENSSRDSLCSMDVAWNSTALSVQWTSGKFYHKNGGLGANSDWYASELIDIESVGPVLKISTLYGFSSSGNPAICYYDCYENLLYSFIPENGSDVVLRLVRNAKYIGISNRNSTPNVYVASSFEDKFDRVKNIESRLEYISGFEKDAVRIYPAIKTMAAISFVFDDGTVEDDSVVTLFESKKALCGFALIGSDAFVGSSGRAGKYLAYQKRGFSCLNHNSSGTNLSDYSTEAEAVAAISLSKRNLENYGFVINGWVCPGNDYVTEYRSDLGKFHGYAYGDHGYGDGTSVNDVNTRTQDILRLRRFSVEGDSRDLNYFKALVDSACENAYYITFYAHAARIGTSGYHDAAFYSSLLDYIIDKKDKGLCFFDSPDACVKYYFNL